MFKLLKQKAQSNEMRQKWTNRLNGNLISSEHLRMLKISRGEFPHSHEEYNTMLGILPQYERDTKEWLNPLPHAKKG